jgi:hypothetical protein
MVFCVYNVPANVFRFRWSFVLHGKLADWLNNSNAWAHLPGFVTGWREWIEQVTCHSA